jgi:hypothetical protein
MAATMTERPASVSTISAAVYSSTVQKVNKTFVILK